MSRNIIYNAIRTPDGTVLESRFTHDYKEYVDANGKTYTVDGGLSYLRRSMHEDQAELSLSDAEPHSVQREIMRWGSYGKKGDEPLHYIRIADMEDAHIRAVINQLHPGGVYGNVLANELVHRKIPLGDITYD